MYEHLFSCYIQNISYDEIYNDMYRLYLFCILKKCLIQKKNYLQIVYINNLCNICLFKYVLKKKRKNFEFIYYFFYLFYRFAIKWKGNGRR